MITSRHDRSLGELFGDMAELLSRLIRQEADLARTEVTSNISRLAKDASMLGAGGVLVHGGFLALVAAAIALLTRLGLDVWISALLVGIVLVAIGALLVDRGRQQMKTSSLAPTATVETLKEDVEWARNPTR